ncbi:hypothetical protein B0H19DRAFT_1238217 [Mycena capillaripes]|nr:hypothetical protein B0H19DRAFT_1238217 [Mycena capillaripes]
MAPSLFSMRLAFVTSRLPTLPIVQLFATLCHHLRAPQSGKSPIRQQVVSSCNTSNPILKYYFRYVWLCCTQVSAEGIPDAFEDNTMLTDSDMHSSIPQFEV